MKLSEQIQSLINVMALHRDRLDRTISALRVWTEAGEVKEEPFLRKVLERVHQPKETIPRRRPKGTIKAKDYKNTCKQCPDRPVFTDSTLYQRHYYAAHRKKMPSKDPQARKAAFNRRVELNAAKISCSPCELNFPNIAALEQHQQKIHGVRFSKSNGIGTPGLERKW